MNTCFRAARALLIVALLPLCAAAAPVAIVNPSFEADPNTFNEFFFGEPTGWSAIDAFGILDGSLDVTGTLEVTGSPYFGGVAPDGDNVAILFVGTDTGGGEIGLRQTLSETLAANTRYTLSVEVGNIESGPTESGQFFDLRGFPGYRIELWAGTTLLDSDTEGTDSPIGEGVFETRTLSFTTGATHAALGDNLEIRLFNLNLDPGLPDDGGPALDLEVDFDDVSLDATIVPLPAAAWLLFPPLAVIAGRRRRGSVQPS